MGYVVRFGNGARKYFKSYREAQAFKAELVKGGDWSEHVHIINIARQRDSDKKVDRKLSMSVGGHTYYGLGLTGDELALMALGRMCEATSHTFRCNFATKEMQVAAQRALRNMVRKGQITKVSPRVKEALELKLHTAGERKGVRR
jgi:hypothetical protein